MKKEMSEWRYVLVGMICLQVVDLGTTWTVLSQGGQELNPFFSWASELIIFYPLIGIAKIGFICIFFGVLTQSWEVNQTLSRFIASSGLAIYGAIAGNNILHLTIPGFCPV